MVKSAPEIPSVEPPLSVYLLTLVSSVRYCSVTNVRVEAVLPLAGGNSCGGALERVAWATLRRRSREDSGHRVGVEAVVAERVEYGILMRDGQKVKWRLACLLVVLLELELTLTRA